MYAVAIGMRSGEHEAAAEALAPLLGRSRHELRLRLDHAGSDPLVIGVVRDRDVAVQSAERLERHDFSATVHPVQGALGPRIVARQFELDPDRFGTESRDRARAELTWSDVDLVVLAARPTREVTPRSAVAPERPLVDLAARIARGGVEDPTHDDEHLAFAFAGERVVVLREHELLYRSLGAAVQPSRAANFRLVLHALRERCTRATWDERLVRAATRAHVLGPAAALDPHLELSVAIVASAVRGGRLPYR